MDEMLRGMSHAESGLVGAHGLHAPRALAERGRSSVHPSGWALPFVAQRRYDDAWRRYIVVVRRYIAAILAMAKSPERGQREAAKTLRAYLAHSTADMNMRLGEHTQMLVQEAALPIAAEAAKRQRMDINNGNLAYLGEYTDASSEQLHAAQVGRSQLRGETPREGFRLRDEEDGKARERLIEADKNLERTKNAWIAKLRIDTADMEMERAQERSERMAPALPAVHHSRDVLQSYMPGVAAVVEYTHNDLRRAVEEHTTRRDAEDGVAREAERAREAKEAGRVRAAERPHTARLALQAFALAAGEQGGVRSSEPAQVASRLTASSHADRRGAFKSAAPALGVGAMVPAERAWYAAAALSSDDEVSEPLLVPPDPFPRAPVTGRTR
jgi:hypothetical protein